MGAYLYEYGIWTRTDSLWHGLGLEGRTGQARFVKGPGPLVIPMAGVGGKTSATRRLAWEAVRRGLKVLVVITTHMVRPDASEASEGDTGGIRTVLGCHDLTVAGRLAEKGKVAFTGWELYREACSLANLVLAEVDGPRRLPLKVLRAGGPVIPGSTDMTLCLSDLPSLGGWVEDYYLRSEEAGAPINRHGRRHYEDNHEPRGSTTGELGRDPENRTDWIIQKEDMMTLINHGYLLPLRADYPGTDVLSVFNQADTSQEAALAGEMLGGMGETSGAADGRLNQDMSARLF